MITFKFDVAEALATAGMTAYKAKETGVLSQETWRKIKKGDAASISMKSLNNICTILNMQPEHVIMYKQGPQDLDTLEKFRK